MRLLRIGPIGKERPAVEDANGVVYDLSEVTPDIDGRFLSSDGVSKVERLLASGALRPMPQAAKMRIGAPIARPGAVICIGMNYAAHAAESGSQPPDSPVVFFKHPNTVVGPFDNVLLPPGAGKVDWEVELAVIIGQEARYLSSPLEARACIAGFAISNDVSERDFQFENGQWSKGKCCETFNPLGPYLVPTGEVDVSAAQIWSRVNGDPRQESSTADMIAGVDELIWHLSHYMVLEPGDVINTGTPEGVALSGRFPYLAPGDVVELGIEGLGKQRQPVVDALAEHSAKA